MVIPQKKHPPNPPFSYTFYTKKTTQKHPLKYNNPHPPLNILYSNLLPTFTLPSTLLIKYNKSPHKKTKKYNQKNKKIIA